DALRVLLVVHRAHARDEAQQRGHNRLRMAARNARRIARRRSGIARKSAGRRGRAGASPRKAGFAEHRAADGAFALLAQRLAAILAESHALAIGMIGAVHAAFLSRLPCRSWSVCSGSGPV